MIKLTIKKYRVYELTRNGYQYRDSYDDIRTAIRVARMIGPKGSLNNGAVFEKIDGKEIPIYGGEADE